MNLFRSFQPAASAPVARERLQILLECDRKLGSQIDLFTVLREEILAVTSRHIVDPEKVQVTVDRGAEFSTLGVNIEIPNTSGKAGTLPTDCPVLHRDKTVGRRGLRVNKRPMGAAAAPGSLALPIWLVGATVGAILLAVKKAGSVPLISVGLIAALVLGIWLYAQQSDVGKRRALDDRETALMAGFEEQVNAPRPAEGAVAATGPSVVLPTISGPGTVGSLPRDPAAPEPVLQSATVTESITSPPQDPQALREPAAVHPVLQSAAVTPPATLGSATSPPNEPPTAPSEEPPPGNVTPLPPRRPLQIRIATPPRAVPPSALLRRREAP